MKPQVKPLVLVLLALLAACERLPQVRVTCQDVERGRYLSADLDRDAVIETPCGWVLVLDRLPPDERVQVYPTCQIDGR